MIPNQNNFKYISTINNPHPEYVMHVDHILNIRPMCPVSNNPLSNSTFNISYLSGDKILDIIKLQNYVDSFNTINPHVRDLELMSQTFIQECSNALNRNVHMDANFFVNVDGQIQTLKLSIDAKSQTKSNLKSMLIKTKYVIPLTAIILYCLFFYKC